MATKTNTGNLLVSCSYFRRGTLSDYSLFCDKLLYIASNAPSKSEFLKKPYRVDKHGDFLTPILILDPVPGVRNKIQTTIGARYYIDYPETKNFDSLTQKFDELETTLTDCLPGHKKTIHSKGKDGDFYQLIKGTSFTI